MDNRIIKTEKKQRRNPPAAALMSLVFIGTGQVYNGELAKACALFLLRGIAFIIIPMHAAGLHKGSPILLFAACLIFAVALTLYSAIEAFSRASSKGISPLKRYNTVPFYAGFALLNTAFTILLMIPVLTLFSIETVRDSSSSPLFKQGDRLLISSPGPAGYARADLVIYGRGRISRIIGLGGDRITSGDGVLVINGEPVKTGIFTEKELSFFSLPQSENLFSETLGTRKYPVYTDPDEAISAPSRYTPPAGSMLLVPDNRKRGGNPETVSQKNIKGRVEGVLFSAGTNRFMIRPFLPGQ